MMTDTQSNVKASIVRMEIEISGHDGSHRYGVSQIHPGEDHSHAYELVKRDQRKPATYHVVRDHDGLFHCDCPDAVYRREGKTSEPCKHVRALLDLGLLAAPSVAPVPEPTRKHVPDEFDEPTPAPCCPASEPALCAPCSAPVESDAAFIARLEHQETAERTRIEATYPTVFQDEPFADEAPELADDDDESFWGPPESWPQWTDRYTWEPAPEPTPAPEPALVDGVDHERRFGPTVADLRENAAATLARPSLARPAAPSRRTRARWDRP